MNEVVLLGVGALVGGILGWILGARLGMRSEDALKRLGYSSED